MRIKPCVTIMLHNHKLNEVAKIVKKFDRDLFKKKRDMKIIGAGHEINHVDSQKKSKIQTNLMIYNVLICTVVIPNPNFLKSSNEMCYASNRHADPHKGFPNTRCNNSDPPLK